MDVTARKRSEDELKAAFEEIKQLKDQLYRENLALRDEVDRASMFEEIVGTSKPLKAVLSHTAKSPPARPPSNGCHCSDYGRDRHWQGAHRPRCAQTLRKVGTRFRQCELCRICADANFVRIVWS